MGPRDPPFMTPLVKNLLNTRRKLLQKNRINEANILAERINELISSIRAHSLANLSHASTKELWDSVKCNSRGRHRPIYNCVGDVNNANNFFASVSYNSSSVCNYDDVYCENDNMQDIHKLYSCDLNAMFVEFLLRNVKGTSPGPDNIPSWVFNSVRTS